MYAFTDAKCRPCLQTVGIAGLAATRRGLIGITEAKPGLTTTSPASSGDAVAMGHVQQVDAGALEVGYYEAD